MSHVYDSIEISVMVISCADIKLWSSIILSESSIA